MGSIFFLFYDTVSSTTKHLPFKDCLDDTDTKILRMCVHLLLVIYVTESETVFRGPIFWRVGFFYRQKRQIEIPAKYICVYFKVTSMNPRGSYTK